VFDKAGSGQMYIDGKADGTPVALNGEVMDLTTNALHIGEAPTGDFPFAGQIASAVIHARALATNEIQQLYADPWAVFRPARRRWPVSGGAPPAGVAELFPALQQQGPLQKTHSLDAVPYF